MIAVLQARLGSTRLPGKAFFTFFGQNMLERAISIARDVQGIDDVVLATGDDPVNAALEASVINAGARFFVGSEHNVLKRFCDAIEHYDGDYLLRMTCDNYLIQPEVVEALHQQISSSDADYAYVEP
ncbi:MAG: NTP transferase domain-containing protein, partial [Pseudomonadales bacterium]